jgi:hypothetical protein
MQNFAWRRIVPGTLPQPKDEGLAEILFADADGRLGGPDIVPYNTGARAHGAISELDPP